MERLASWKAWEKKKCSSETHLVTLKVLIRVHRVQRVKVDKHVPTCSFPNRFEAFNECWNLFVFRCSRTPANYGYCLINASWINGWQCWSRLKYFHNCWIPLKTSVMTKYNTLKVPKIKANICKIAHFRIVYSIS